MKSPRNPGSKRLIPMNVHNELFNGVRQLRWQHLSPVVSTFSTSIRLLSSVFLISGLSCSLEILMFFTVRHIQYPVNPSSYHFHTGAVVPSSDHCRTGTVLPPSDHYCIDIVAPSSDHYCIDRTVPSSDHCCIETVPPSSDRYGTIKVALPSGQLHTKRT